MTRNEQNFFMAAQNSLRNWHGLNVSVEEICEIVKRHDAESLEDELAEVVYEEGELGLDTFVRDWVSDCFAREVGYTSWPLNYQGPEVAKAFFEKLYALAVEKGWR